MTIKEKRLIKWKDNGWKVIFDINNFVLTQDKYTKLYLLDHFCNKEFNDVSLLNNTFKCLSCKKKIPKNLEIFFKLLELKDKIK